MHLGATPWWRQEGTGQVAFAKRQRKSQSAAGTIGPWLTVRQAAQRAQCGVKTIYREAKAGRLRVTYLGGRRELRTRAEWVDHWLEGATKTKEVA